VETSCGRDVAGDGHRPVEGSGPPGAGLRCRDPRIATRLTRLIAAKDAETIRLHNGVEIACFANSYRLVRGPTCVCAILDEVAVWWSDQLSANPDREIFRALKPAMITQPGSLLIGLSSPYAKKGLLYEKYRDHFGRDDSKVLIWQADTATMNPQVDKEEIEAAYHDDPISAAAEFGAQFRDDLQTYIVPEAIEACVERGVYERSPLPGVTYFGFIDPAGGSGQDAMTWRFATTKTTLSCSIACESANRRLTLPT